MPSSLGKNEQSRSIGILPNIEEIIMQRPEEFPENGFQVVVRKDEVYHGPDRKHVGDYWIQMKRFENGRHITNMYWLSYDQGGFFNEDHVIKCALSWHNELINKGE